MEYNVETDRKTSAKKDDPKEVIARVKDCLYEAWESDKDNRIDAASDLNFLAGNQWPEQQRQQREKDGRPMLTINKLPQFVRQVTNDVRQANVGITCVPTDGAVIRAQKVRNVESEQRALEAQAMQQRGMGDNGGPPMEPAEPKLTMAEVYNGLIREIQYQSSASHVYATAAEHQVSCGIGHFRIITEYESDESFDQCIKVREIKQPLSVYWDPGATEPDRSDAQWCIITETIPRKSFKKKYPKASETSIEDYDVKQSELYWSSEDEIRIAEYWCKKPVKKTLARIRDEETGEAQVIEWPKGEPIPEGLETRTVDTHEVWQYVVSGADILEEPKRWIGKHIPIVPVIGSEIPLERKTYRYGLIRFARDPQVLYNFARTSAAESMGLAPKSPWLVPMRMIKPFKEIWDVANKKLLPYLPYADDPQNPGLRPTREAPPDVPMAYVQESGVADSDIKSTVGIYDPQLGQRSSENSGRAILAREQQGDTGTFHYSDNLKRALEYAGRILVDLIPKIYDSERTLRILGEDGAEMYLPVNMAATGPDGMPAYINDLSQGRYDVRVKIGPSYATKRMESADAMMQFMQAFPPSAGAIGDLVADAMDWPGSKAIAERLRRMVPAEILGEDAPPQPPDPMQEVQFNLVQKQLEKLDAEIQKLKSETVKNEVSAGKTVAETDKIETETDLMPLDREYDEMKWEAEQANRDLDRDLSQSNYDMDRYDAEQERQAKLFEASMRNSTNGARQNGESRQ